MGSMLWLGLAFKYVILFSSSLAIVYQRAHEDNHLPHLLGVFCLFYLFSNDEGKGTKTDAGPCWQSSILQ